MTTNQQHSREPLPLDEAPDLVPASEAHLYLPISRSSVYEAVKAGTIQVQRLPVRAFVTKAELARIRGYQAAQPDIPNEQPARRRYRRPGALAGRVTPMIGAE
jgi:hypothetical protein